MGQATSEIFNKATTPVHDLKSKVQRSEDQLEAVSRQAGEKVGALASDIASTASGYVKAGREYVQENPSKGVAVAAAAGLVAGCLITLALRRRN